MFPVDLQPYGFPQLFCGYETYEPVVISYLSVIWFVIIYSRCVKSMVC